jgi:23S rRNA pseudouridine1911/1915/1917 synthase
VRRIVADRAGERLDVAVGRLCDISRAQAQRLIDEGLVAEDAGRVRRRAGDRLEGGEVLSVRVPAPVAATPIAEAIALSIVFEDAEMLVVDKPAGMPVHPGPGHSNRTLVNALLAHCPDLPGIGGVQRPGIVHRLDKDTSGLIVVAKTERAHNRLSAQLSQREMHKTYVALLEGTLKPAEALIDAPIGRDPNNRQRMMVRGSGGRDAQTHYIVRSYHKVRPELAQARGDNSYTLAEASPITGRTHQIRVHFASLGHPVVGDPVYGKRSPLVARQFLHAWRLAFRHPADGRELSFEAPLPDDLESALAKLARAGQ